jgi:hypothetical protein
MQADTVYKRGGATGFPDYPPPIAVDAALLVPPPPAPMPQRFGMPHPVPSIMDVLRTVRLYPDARYRTSGYAEPGYSGSARNSWW